MDFFAALLFAFALGTSTPALLILAEQQAVRWGIITSERTLIGAIASDDAPRDEALVRLASFWYSWLPATAIFLVALVSLLF